MDGAPRRRSIATDRPKRSNVSYKISIITDSSIRRSDRRVDLQHVDMDDWFSDDIPSNEFKFPPVSLRHAQLHHARQQRLKVRQKHAQQQQQQPNVLEHDDDLPLGQAQNQLNAPQEDNNNRNLLHEPAAILDIPDNGANLDGINRCYDSDRDDDQYNIYDFRHRPRPCRYQAPEEPQEQMVQLTDAKLVQSNIAASDLSSDEDIHRDVDVSVDGIQRPTPRD